MTVQNRKHDMDKLNTRIRDFITNNRMPATMAVVAFTPFAHVDRCLDFEPYTIAAISSLIDEIGVALIVVMLVGAVGIHGV